MSKLLTVFGATGQQGGALINHILNNPELSKLYHLRGITRDATKATALTLKSKGIELIEADLDDPPTLTTAVRGSYAVFAVTNYWEKASAAVEIAQGKAVADASVTEGVQLLIWSSLPSITDMTRGRRSMAHFDSKAEVETYIRDLPIKGVYFMAGGYMQNHLSVMRPTLNEQKEWVYRPMLDNAKVPMIDINDTGKFVAPVLLRPEMYVGKRLTCATAYYTPQQLVEGWTELTKSKVVCEFKAKGDVAELMDEFSYFGPTGEEDLKWTLEQMSEAPTEWHEFVRANEPWFVEA